MTTTDLDLTTLKGQLAPKKTHHQMTRIELIWSLVERGILGREQCPYPNYWHWPVLQPDELNEDLRAQYFHWGEVRWHGEENW